MILVMNTAVTRNDWVGRVIDGRFPLLEWLGNTEQAGVFRTELEGPQPARAVIRLIPAQPEYAEARLERWKQAAALTHPHLMRIFASGRAQVGGVELLYVVTEYADEALAEVIPERPLSQGEGREMLGPILDALAYLHGQGMVHGRIKPSNIMVVGDRLKLSSESVQPFGRVGDPQGPLSTYDAPEVASGNIFPASDIWALGITLAEALEQEAPKWDRATQRDPAVSSGIPEPFAAIVRGCLRFDAAKRATLRDLKALLNPSTSVPGPAIAASREVVADTRGGRDRHRSRATMIAIACVVVIALAAIVFALMRSHSPQPAPPVAQSPTRAIEPPASSPPEARHPNSTGITKGEVAERVMPDLLSSANRTIRGKVDVTVRVDVDSSGRVANATLASRGSSRYFNGKAVEAARMWHFKPAERDGAPVSSIWDLHFEFRRTGPEVNAIEVSP